MNLKLFRKETPRKVLKQLPYVDSIDLTQYIIAYVGPVNQMQLQKMVYCLESYHLVSFNQSLVEDEFEAWMKGPISLKIWNYYKNICLVFDPIDLKKISPEDFSAIEQKIKKALHPEQVNLINKVLDQTIGLTEYELECLIQQDEAWQAARKGYDTATICRELISKDKVKAFYSRQLSLTGIRLA